MKLSNRQLLISAIKPMLFFVVIYCVVLISSLMVCSSVYHAINDKKPVEVEVKTASIQSEQQTTISKQ